jgi:DNA polymerase-3 subunit gamma/tau
VTALYRKYRPQTFDEVVGQEAVVRTLSNAIESGKIRQAYLFAGPRGTGKTSMARILAKSVNCKQGPTAHPDNTCHPCVSISNGTSLDVIEMDAASQRGIDDIREIRERVVLQPVEGRSKVYILDEAHQLTDAAWNALLKLIEEPPPHLLFIFCTTDLAKVLPTVRSRCQTFVFQRPRLPDLVRKLRLIADAEEISVPDAALALIARGGRGAFRDAESTLDQLASATSGTISVQDVLALLGAIEDEVLFRLCDLVVDQDTAGALGFLEELSEHGVDHGRLVTDLLEHLRHLMLVQHIGEVPDTLPVTEETRERLREQANQLAAATVLRLIDLLHVAVEDMRQGGDPRLPLELALVKVTRASSDLSRESLAFRLERLESGAVVSPSAVAVTPVAAPAPHAEKPPPRAEERESRELAAPELAAPELAAPELAAPELAAPELAGRGPAGGEPASRGPVGGESASLEPADLGPPTLALEQLQEAWRRSVIPAVEHREPGGMPAAAMLAQARPGALDGDTLTLEFPSGAEFHRARAEEPKNVALLKDALYEVTGRRLEVVFATGEHQEAKPEAEHPTTEEGFVELMKTTFDARELDI